MKKNNIFISYSRKDYDFVSFLYNLLSLYKESLNVWIDESIDAGNKWQQIINQEIDNSNIFIAVFSEDFDDSIHCRGEFSRFYQRKNLDDSLIIIPIKIDDYASYDTSKFHEPRVAQFNWVDFTDWQIRGDRIFVKELFSTVCNMQKDKKINSSSDVSSPEVLYLKKVLHDYKNKISNDKQAKDLIFLITIYTQNDKIPTLDRAELLTELSELFLRRGEWKKLLNFNSKALLLLQDEEIKSEEDRVNTLLGLIFIKLSLAHRKLKTKSPKGFLIESLKHFNKLSNKILSSDFQAQVYRELGTYYLIKNELDEAKKAFDKSSSLLKYLPSQREHFIQAKIKNLQVSLFSQNFQDVQLILNQLENSFNKIGLESVHTEVIYCHYLITKSLALILIKESTMEIKKLLETHRKISLKHNFKNEILKNRILRFSYLVLLPLPTTFIVKSIQIFFKIKK